MLRDTIGQPVLQAHDALTRDRLSCLLTERGAERGIDGCCLLDLRSLGNDVIASHFTTLERTGRELVGVQLAQDPLLVRPLMHRLLGGIETDPDGVRQYRLRKVQRH